MRLALRLNPRPLPFALATALVALSLLVLRRPAAGHGRARAAATRVDPDTLSRLHALMPSVLDAHFAPVAELGGIHKAAMDAVAGGADANHACRVLQRVGGRTFLVPLGGERAAWTGSKHFHLQRLAAALALFPWADAGDVELAICTGDCSPHPDSKEEPAAVRSPLLAMVGCGGSRPVVPIVAWMSGGGRRDGPLPGPGEAWAMRGLAPRTAPWSAGIHRATFIGTARSHTMFGCTDEPPPAEKTFAFLRGARDLPSILAHPSSCRRPSLITPGNFMRVGSRQKLARFAAAHPGLLAVSLWPDRGTGSLFPARPREPPPPDVLASASNRTVDHGFVVGSAMALSVEGSCGWSDRFKLLMALGLLAIKQASHCREWYEGFLHPWREFIPADARMDAVPLLVRWAGENPGEAEAIARRGTVAARALTSGGFMRAYMGGVLRRWANLTRYEVVRRPGAVRMVVDPERGPAFDGTAAALDEMFPDGLG